MRTLHAHWVWVALATNGAVGLWGMTLAVLRRSAGRWFGIGVRIAVIAMLIQVGLGFGVYSEGLRPGSEFHLFYGFMVLFTFAFAYIFRDKIAQRPAVVWGPMLLWTMGLAIRAWANVAG